MRVTCCPCGVLKTTAACAIPGASEGLISTIFQVSCWFQPNIFLRKASTVASLGSEVLAAVVAVGLAAELALDELVFWATQYTLIEKMSSLIEKLARRLIVPFEE